MSLWQALRFGRFWAQGPGFKMSHLERFWAQGLGFGVAFGSAFGVRVLGLGCCIWGVFWFSGSLRFCLATALPAMTYGPENPGEPHRAPEDCPRAPESQRSRRELGRAPKSLREPAREAVGRKKTQRQPKSPEIVLQTHCKPIANPLQTHCKPIENCGNAKVLQHFEGLGFSTKVVPRFEACYVGRMRLFWGCLPL